MWYGVGEIVLVLCCGSGGVNRSHVTLFCAYVDTVNDCRVSVCANVCIGDGSGAGDSFEFSERRRAIDEWRVYRRLGMMRPSFNSFFVLVCSLAI